MEKKAASGTMLTLLIIGMLTFAFNTQAVNAPNTTSNSLKVIPEYPFPWDEVNVTVSFTTATLDAYVDFGDTIQEGNTFHVYIIIEEGGYYYIATHTRTYNLGELPVGSYTLIAHYYRNIWPPEWEESITFTVDLVHVIDHTFVCYGYTLHIVTTSNSTISAFEFTPETKQISFNVDGPSETIGFCNVTVSKALLNGEFQILFEDAPTAYTLTQNITHSFLYFTYNHHKHTVKIIGTTVMEPPPPNVIRVPDNCLTIQEAVDVASWGDIIQVASGTYYEHVEINKPLTLVGENPNTTIIDGNGAGSIFFVTSDQELRWVGVKIIGFTISNGEYGIELLAEKNVIYNNIITSNRYGIVFDESSYNTIIGNSIIYNREYGIHSWMSTNNVIYHNNFIYNKWDHVISLISTNYTWDNGYSSGGNYWSDYIGVDLYSGPYQNESGSDGIGDTRYVIETGAVDRYPLMKTWAPILGDMDSDGYVGPIDLSMFAAVYGKHGGDDLYNRLADLDSDSYIGPIDLSIFAANYGKHI